MLRIEPTPPRDAPPSPLHNALALVLPSVTVMVEWMLVHRFLYDSSQAMSYERYEMLRQAIFWQRIVMASLALLASCKLPSARWRSAALWFCGGCLITRLDVVIALAVLYFLFSTARQSLDAVQRNRPFL